MKFRDLMVRIAGALVRNRTETAKLYANLFVQLTVVCVIIAAFPLAGSTAELRIVAAVACVICMLAAMFIVSHGRS
ncbi:hypothetical protein [Sutterella sp.]|uniref:hypothetical protein n=1 Tax=Sutterella sp. TaxID=1981025 RepID=UPI0026E09DC0|nr:hypothetical protein [Sutterella sp.]MDO5531828.1 hypothetical protein [Sutterella sp.]